MVFETLQSLVVQQPIWKQLVNFEKSSTKEDTGQKKNGTATAVNDF